MIAFRLIIVKFTWIERFRWKLLYIQALFAQISKLFLYQKKDYCKIILKCTSIKRCRRRLLYIRVLFTRHQNDFYTKRKAQNTTDLVQIDSSKICIDRTLSSKTITSRWPVYSGRLSDFLRAVGVLFRPLPAVSFLASVLPVQNVFPVASGALLPSSPRLREVNAEHYQ